MYLINLNMNYSGKIRLSVDAAAIFDFVKTDFTIQYKYSPTDFVFYFSETIRECYCTYRCLNILGGGRQFWQLG